MRSATIGVGLSLALLAGCAQSVQDSLPKPEVTQAQSAFRSQAATIDLAVTTQDVVGGAMVGAVLCAVLQCDGDDYANAILGGAAVGSTPQRTFMNVERSPEALSEETLKKDIRWSKVLTKRFLKTEEKAQVVLAEAPQRVAALNADIADAVFPTGFLQQRYTSLTVDLSALGAAISIADRSVKRLGALEAGYAAKGLDVAELAAARSAQEGSRQRLTGLRREMVGLLREVSTDIRGDKISSMSPSQFLTRSAARRAAQDGVR